MLKFLQSWKENSLHLNPDKIQLRKDESKYIGHLIITRSIKVDPAKIEAIQKMQTPKGTPGVKMIIGMCQYLHTFLPKWSNKSIKKTDRKKIKHATGLIIKKRSHKECNHKTPVLAYYDVNKPTTIQCDASDDTMWIVRRMSWTMSVALKYLV